MLNRLSVEALRPEKMSQEFLEMLLSLSQIISIDLLETDESTDTGLLGPGMFKSLSELCACIFERCSDSTLFFCFRLYL